MLSLVSFAGMTINILVCCPLDWDVNWMAPVQGILVTRISANTHELVHILCVMQAMKA